MIVQQLLRVTSMNITLECFVYLFQYVKHDFFKCLLIVIMLELFIE